MSDPLEELSQLVNIKPQTDTTNNPLDELKSLVDIQPPSGVRPDTPGMMKTAHAQADFNEAGDGSVITLDSGEQVPTHVWRGYVNWASGQKNYEPSDADASVYHEFYNEAKQGSPADATRVKKPDLHSQENTQSLLRDYPSLLRPVVAGAMSGTAGMLGTTARVLGDEENADAINRQVNNITPALAGSMQGSVIPESVSDTMMGVADALTKTAVSAPLGAIGTAVNFAFNGYNSAKTRAKDAGLDEGAADRYATIQGAIDGTWGLVASKLGLGSGAFKVTSGVMQQVLNGLKEVIAEVPVLQSMDFLSRANSILNDVEKNGDITSSSELLNNLKNSFTMAAGFKAAGVLSATASDVLMRNADKIEQIASLPKASRNAFQKIGINDTLSAQERADIVKAAGDQIAKAQGQSASEHGRGQNSSSQAQETVLNDDHSGDYLYQSMKSRIPDEIPNMRDRGDIRVEAPQSEVESIGAGGMNYETAGKIEQAQRSIADVIVGGSYPKLTRANSAAGEATVRHAAARAAAPYIADAMYARVFGSDKALADKVGAVLAEDNLRSIKAEYEKAGKSDDAAKVASLVEERASKETKQKNFAFKTEAEYRAALADPNVQAAIQKWKEIVNTWMDEQYRTLTGRLGSDELPTRGLETGARINLKQAEKKSSSGGAIGNLMNPKRVKSVFARQASGSSDYDFNARNILNNSVGQSWVKATRVNAYKAIEQAGLGQILPMNAKGPDNARSIEITMPERIEVKDGEKTYTTTKYSTKNLWVPEDLYSEVRQALKVDEPVKGMWWTKALNFIQVAGLGDLMAHTANIRRAIQTSPDGKNFFTGSLRKLPGVSRIDAWSRITSEAAKILKQDPETLKIVAELAQEGAMRPKGEHGGPTGKLLELVDKAGRVALAKMHDGLAARGLLEDTATSRREFVNQVGQYNTSMQNRIVGFLKQTGLSPFVTAGTNFARVGAKSLVGGYGGKATSNSAAIRLRAEQIAGNVVAPVVIAAAANYLFNGKTPKGVPVGSVYLGNDDKGKPRYVDLLDEGVVRRGLRATGLDKAIEGSREGRFSGQIADRAMRDIVDSAIHPFAGPPIQFASIAATGHPFSLAGDSAERAPVGTKTTQESQLAQNLKAALKHSNPTVSEAFKAYDESRINGSDTAVDKLKSLGKGAIAPIVNAEAKVKTGQPFTSKAQDLAMQYLRRRYPERAYTEEDKQKQAVRSQLVADIRNGVSADEAISKAMGSGQITAKQALLSKKKASQDAGLYTFKQLALKEANDVMKYATDKEKELWEPEYQRKIAMAAAEVAAPRPMERAKIEQWQARVNDGAKKLKDVQVSFKDAKQALVKYLRDTMKDHDELNAKIARFVRAASNTELGLK